jgi:colanic acid/amylovoran biosynthesis protein
MRRSPQILLIHFHSMQNAGDAAQLSAAIRILQQEWIEPRLILAANHPQESDLRSLPVEVVPSITSLIGMGRRSSTLVKAYNLISAFFRILVECVLRSRSPRPRESSTGWHRLFAAYRNADLVISVPGNIFFSMGRFGFPFLCSSLAVLPALCHRKPLYVMPQSIGPLKRQWEKWILRQTYRRARMVFLREPVSYRLAQEIGLTMDRVKLALDPTIELTETIRNDIPRRLRRMGYRTGTKSIGVTVIPRMVRSLSQSHLESYYIALAGALSFMADRYDAEIYFFPQVTGPMPHEDDRRAFQEVTSRMTCSGERINAFQQPMNPEELKALYRWMDVFVASRLHSGIFAMCEGVPTLMIGYLTKSLGMMEALNARQWLLDLAAIDPGVLTEKLESLWLQKDVIRAQLTEGIENAIRRSPKIGEEITQDYFNGFG